VAGLVAGAGSSANALVALNAVKAMRTSPGTFLLLVFTKNPSGVERTPEYSEHAPAWLQLMNGQPYQGNSCASFGGPYSAVFASFGPNSALQRPIYTGKIRRL
jgi:hypothetical protein